MDTNQLHAQGSNSGTGVQLIVGNIRINQKNYNDAFVNCPNCGPDILVDGIRNRMTALEGDTVKVQLHDSSQWGVIYNTIADRWDDWSQYLLPIIQRIEKQTNFLQQIKSFAITDNPSIHDSNLSSCDTSSPSHQHEATSTNGSANKATISILSRKKRSVVADKSKDADEVLQTPTKPNKLPSNLPSGIMNITVKDLLTLPFYERCVRKTGFVVDIVKRNHSGIAGGYLKKFSDFQALFSPIDSRIPRMLIDIKECPLDFNSEPKRYENVLFVAKVNSWDPKHGKALGNMVKIVGNSDSLQSRVQILLMENNIYDVDFDQDCYKELEYLKNLPENWFKQNSTSRRDFTDECVFTIDPKTARDLDDALSIKQLTDDIYEVGVHIADVAYFVKELTQVDYHARLRTTSVYLVDRVIPMLPRILCEQMCSLNAGEKKFTFSVVWKLDKYGRIIDEWFGRTVIKSCVKLAYEQAQDMIDRDGDISWIKEESNMPKLYAHDWNKITKSVLLLNMISKNLRAKRFDGGALRIDNVKMKYELDKESGLPIGFSFESRTAANFLIEEFMLLANMAVATKIYQYNKDFAFLRRHPMSSPQLLQEVKEFCDAKGFPFDVTSAGSLQKSLNSISDPVTLKVVTYLLLKSMKPAEYICAGAYPDDFASYRHFALNVPLYTHFTSPIRRYPDIIVHRQLAMALKLDNDDTNEDLQSLILMADECTKRKISSKLISDSSQRLYFNMYVLRAGFCELLACVLKIYDHSFDIVLVDYDRKGRVYLDKLQGNQLDFKFESFAGVRKLVLNWKIPEASQDSREKKKKPKKSKNKHAKLPLSSNPTDEQIGARESLNSRRGIVGPKSNMSIREVVNGVQTIEVFSVIRVIVTVDPKDFTQLKFDLKAPT